MSGDDKGNDRDDGSDEELPRPEVTLKEEGYSRKQGGQNATNGLWTEMQDVARHEATHATEQAEIGKESLPENTGKPHQATT